MTLAAAVAGSAIAMITFAILSTRSTGEGNPRASEPPSAAEARQLGLTAVIPAGLRRACSAARDRLPADTVRCPRLVPMGRIAGLRQYKLYFPGVGTDPSSYGFDLATRGSDLGRPGHWVAGGGEADYVAQALEESAAASRTVDGIVVRRHRTDPLSGLNQGHVSASWRDGRRAFFVSVHGMRNERRAVVMAQAMRATAVSVDAAANGQ